MLVVRCPQCGVPSSASLAQAGHIACPSCGYVGLPEADAAQQLQAASLVLRSIDVRARQLTDRQRRALLRARGGAWRLLAFLFVGLLPLAPCGLCSGLFLLGDQRSSFPLFMMCASPFLFLAMTGGVVVVWAWRQQRKLEEACAAAPPRVAGQGACCHVCGGELPPPDLAARGIVRCPYCQADNMVDARVLARLGHKRSADIGDFEASVRHEGSRLGLTTGLATGVVVLLALLAPLSCLASAFVVQRVATGIERPVNEQRHYLLVETPAGPCFTYVNQRYSDGSAHVILGKHERGVRGTNYVAGAALHPTVTAEWAVGRSVRFYHHSQWKEGVVARTHGTLVDHANHAIVVVDGAELSPRVVDLCFAQAPSDLASLPWPEMSTHPRDVESLP